MGSRIHFRPLTPELPRISVITPSYNQAEFIGQTIESILSQEYPDLEHIVIDAGSTDGTVELLQGYGDRLRWVSEPDRGQSHAINKGFAMATGEILAFLNSDDLYEPGALLAVGRYFADHPECSWLTGKCRVIDRLGREIRGSTTAYKNAWLKLGSFRVLQVLNYVSQPATFWRRSVIEEVGEVDESLAYAMDYDFLLRIAKRASMHYMPRYLASFRIHPQSKSGSAVHEQFEADYEIATRHVSSRVLLALHRLHNFITVSTYRLLLPREERRSQR